MDNPRHIQEMLDQARQGDIVMLYQPTWVQTCISHHGIEHIAGFYRGTSGGNIILSQDADKDLIRMPLEDIDSVRIINQIGPLRNVDEFYNDAGSEGFNRADVFNLDVLLLHKKDGKKAIGFYLNHGEPEKDPSGDRTVHLAQTRKGAEVAVENIYRLKDIDGFQVVDKFMLDPDNDGIDCLLIDVLDGHPRLLERMNAGEYKSMLLSEAE